MQKITLTASAVTQTPLSIIDRVKTFEDACKVLNITGEVFSASFHDALTPDVAAIEAHLKLMIIIKALNEGWIPNWDNDDEEKYYPWFNMESGFGLNHVTYDYAYSLVGSRLCFKNEDLATYAAKQFLDLYKQYFCISK